MMNILIEHWCFTNRWLTHHTEFYDYVLLHTKINIYTQNYKNIYLILYLLFLIRK
jgi:hypothetical protein